MNTEQTSKNIFMYKSKRLLYFARSSIRNHIAIDNCYCMLSLCKTKKVQYKTENKELKKVRMKNRTSYYFEDLEDFSIDNISINAKSQKNILIYDFSYKNLIGCKCFSN